MKLAYDFLLKVWAFSLGTGRSGLRIWASRRSPPLEAKPGSRSSMSRPAMTRRGSGSTKSSAPIGSGPIRGRARVRSSSPTPRPVAPRRRRHRRPRSLVVRLGPARYVSPRRRAGGATHRQPGRGSRGQFFAALGLPGDKPSVLLVEDSLAMVAWSDEVGTLHVSRLECLPALPW